MPPKSGPDTKHIIFPENLIWTRKLSLLNNTGDLSFDIKETQGVHADFYAIQSNSLQYMK